MLPVRLHAVGKHLCFLLEVAFDLLVKGVFPNIAHRPLQDERGDRNHQQEDDH